MHKDAINEDDVVLLHDDLLATGGTLEAACKLVIQMIPKKVYVNFIIELKELHGKDVFGDDVEVEAVLELDIRLYKEESVELLSDLYSTGCEVVSEQGEVCFDRLLTRNSC